MRGDDPILRSWRDATNAYLAGMGLPPLKELSAAPRELYLRAPCESLVKPADLDAHKESCEACLGGWSVLDRPECEERRLDDPRRGQADAINRERYKP